MRPNIDDFLECLHDYDFINVFDKWETYLWSNFPFNPTKDVDIMFIGELTKELEHKIVSFRKYAKDNYNMKIDECILKDTKLFAHIEEYNRTGEMSHSNIIKHRLDQDNKLIKQISTGVNDKYKWRYGKLHLRYPILIKDFINLVYNIRNSDIYNTPKDKRSNKFNELRIDYRRSKNNYEY